MHYLLSGPVIALCLVATVSAAEPVDSPKPETIVLKSEMARVNTVDIERYIVENLPIDERERAAVLRRNKVFREMAESIYAMRALAAEAASVPGFDEEQARWAAEIAYQRKVVEQYRADYIRSVLEPVNWEALAREEYNANSDRYLGSETVSASHILIKPDDRGDEAARALAAELRRRAVQGEDFSALAREYSEDTSTAKRGGQLGYFQRGKMVPQFEQAAFALASPGDISEPVKSVFGYHVIMLEEHIQAGKLPFAKVKDQIINTLQVQLGNRVWQDKIIAIRSSPDIVIDDEALAALRKKYNPVKIDQ